MHGGNRLRQPHRLQRPLRFRSLLQNRLLREAPEWFPLLPECCRLPGSRFRWHPHSCYQNPEFRSGQIHSASLRSQPQNRLLPRRCFRLRHRSPGRPACHCSLQRQSHCRRHPLSCLFQFRHKPCRCKQSYQWMLQRHFLQRPGFPRYR